MPGHRKHYVLLFLVGALGLLAEVVGAGMVFAWTQQPPPRDLASPQLFVGLLLAFAGFVIIVRGVAFIAKRIIMVLAHA